MNAVVTKKRCAVYTRVSTDERLDQSFNSLDAQRESCEAYITSQLHEGWKALSTAYDDGAYSGGTMERPALKQLLADVGAGHAREAVHEPPREPAQGEGGEAGSMKRRSQHVERNSFRSDEQLGDGTE